MVFATIDDVHSGFAVNAIGAISATNCVAFIAAHQIVSVIRTVDGVLSGTSAVNEIAAVWNSVAR